jgi:hypothetical protein
VKSEAARRAKVLESDMVILPAVVYRKVFGLKFTPKGGGWQMIEEPANYYQPS